jgi:prepilin-type N-terminal cleavage/methylation domain-containing protein/prepilin-type processing-associated H-X9-DG protein
MEMRMSACPRSHSRRAFTLVELLVVVAIIAIMIAILVPTLANVRETAKTALCANNMREMGQLVKTFADSNDGRGPGGGNWGDPSTHPNSQSWVNIINAEVVGRSAYAVTRTGAPSPKNLSCPKYVGVSSGRQWAINDAIVNSANGVPDDPRRHIRGYNADGSAQSYAYTAAGGTHPEGVYRLGAKLIRFGPDQFMIVEHERASDSVGGAASLLLGNDPTYPPYAANGGGWGFRHPYFKAANFLYIDGHVQLLTVNDDVTNSKRYSLQ